MNINEFGTILGLKISRPDLTQMLKNRPGQKAFSGNGRQSQLIKADQRHQ